MSRLCENCHRRIYLPRFPTPEILRQDPVTGYTCKFCSDECVREWRAKREEFAPAAVAGIVPAMAAQTAAIARAPAANETSP